jgi:hypothetical protein
MGMPPIGLPKDNRSSAGAIPIAQWLLVIGLIVLPSYRGIMGVAVVHAEQPAGGAMAGERLRILVSTDIGGSDEDDIQSMIHLLMYADLFDIEGLVSSPPHGGRVADIFKVIDAYETDLPKLKSHSSRFPEPKYLRSISRQGAIQTAPEVGYSQPTEGSQWIIERAESEDPRPLYVLVWGSITDIAQAVHDQPGIKQKLRVHFIASWNREQDPHAFRYLDQNHADMWMIQDETSFRGWYTGGQQAGDLGNRTFVSQHISGGGALGTLFAPLSGGQIKMGDTPTVSRLLRGTPEDPTQPSWGGQFVLHPQRSTWWIDSPQPEHRQDNRPGAKTVNRWREAFLRDWQGRLEWLR